MKRVLIPTDFSDNSFNALQYAKVLFNNEECTFFLLNVYLSNPSNLLNENYSDSMLTEMANESEIELKKLAKKVNKENNNVEHYYETVSKANTLVKTINSTIASKKIEYVIMGTKGAKGAKEIFLGSNAVKVINAVDNCPIIVVPKDYSVTKPSLITFSTNFKRAFFNEELEPLIEIAIANNAKINIARIMQEEFLTDIQKENRKMLKKLLKNIDYIFCKIDVETSETNALKDFAKNTESDLITLIHHKYNFLQRLVKEDVVDKISFNSAVPLLILPKLN
ncbi:universal stress protein [Aquimarina algicola]|uniref:Universal stress protein n=1 Tax=Aquimarina algicola TaxID=2589995 RepID=A0A504JC40_9FLAO|nr:universal stress protein [Aquimarina algicola]TPN84489.1 universal stress protein [Aquimarina algicola]